MKFHNDRQTGKRKDYFRKYNEKHQERYNRIGIDIEFEKWKSEYYHECSCFGDASAPITEEELWRQYLKID